MRFFVLLQFFVVQAFLVHNVLSVAELPTTDMSLTVEDMEWVKDETARQLAPLQANFTELKMNVTNLELKSLEFQTRILKLTADLEKLKNPDSTCVDSKEGFMYKDELKACSKITEAKKNKYCKKTEGKCPVACGECPDEPLPPSPITGCIDTEESFNYKGKKYCTDITEETKKKLCRKADGKCPATCGECPDEPLPPSPITGCIDTEESFNYKGKKYCTDITEETKKKLCRKADGKCPASCGECPDEPLPPSPITGCIDTEESFNYKGKKYCTDITEETKKKLCRKADGKCPATCDEC